MENIWISKIISSSGKQLDTRQFLAQAIEAGKGCAASLGEPILIIETLNGHRRRSFWCFPDGHTERLDTSFERAKKRLISEFAAEIETLGLKVRMGPYSMYHTEQMDGDWYIQLYTLPEPVEGSEDGMKALETAGYHVGAYPSSQTGGLVFHVNAWRKIEITAADEELTEEDMTKYRRKSP